MHKTYLLHGGTIAWLVASTVLIVMGLITTLARFDIFIQIGYYSSLTLGMGIGGMYGTIQQIRRNSISKLFPNQGVLK